MNAERSQPLAGWVALVTGGGAGFGRGIAEELASAGADIAVLEIDPGSGERAASGLAGRGVRTRAYATDVSDPRQVDAAFEAVVRDLGRLDIAVNNAGISRVGPNTQDTTDEDWQASIAVMQSGVFYCRGADHAPAGLGQRGQHLVDPRLLAEPRPHRLLRSEGGRDHDDEGRRRGVGAARRPRERDRAGRDANADVGSGRRPRRDRRAVLPRRRAHARIGMPAEGGKLAVYPAPTPRRTSRAPCT